MKLELNQRRGIKIHASSWMFESYLMEFAFKVGKLALRDRAPALVSGAGIILRDNKLLLIERQDGYGWCLPGGIVRGEESLEEALMREVYEETGFWVKPICLFQIYSGKRRDPRWPSICAVYCCTILRGQKRESAEGRPSWVPIDGRPGRWAFDTERIIRDYRSAISEPFSPYNVYRTSRVPFYDRGQ